MYRYYRSAIVRENLRKITMRVREKRWNYIKKDKIMAFDDLMKDKTELVNEIKEVMKILEKKYRIY